MISSWGKWGRSKNYCCMNEFRPKKIVVENYISSLRWAEATLKIFICLFVTVAEPKKCKDEWYLWRDLFKCFSNVSVKSRKIDPRKSVKILIETNYDSSLKRNFFFGWSPHVNGISRKNWPWRGGLASSGWVKRWIYQKLLARKGQFSD